jgi:hypothetical protein
MSEYEVTFKKKDNSDRTMICSNNLPEPKGSGRCPAHIQNSYMLVFDVEKQNYRLVNLETTSKVVVNSEEYEVS